MAVMPASKKSNPPAGLQIRPLRAEELGFLREMLYQALYVPEGEDPPPREILYEPQIARYVTTWNIREDLALVAEAAIAGDEAADAASGDAPATGADSHKLIGAIWGRRFSEDEPGFGFVSEDTTELSMAVSPEYRGRGVGAALLEAFLADVRKRGRPAISLSVDRRNPALRFYERAGFAEHATAGNSVTMLLRLS